MIRKTLMAAAAAATLGAVALPALSQTTYVVRSAPPAPLQEAHADRPGHVWSEGHWAWNGNRYVWQRGHWIRDRTGYAYSPAHWVQRPNGTWVFVAESWQPERMARRGGRGDRDHDGVANRNDQDRDGDGVRNKFDRFPNNPNRS